MTQLVWIFPLLSALAAHGYSVPKSRRAVLSAIPQIVVPPVFAATFTPGGTLVDRPVGINVGNSEASRTRKFDNSNVLFQQDYYFKFGTAAPWIDESNRLEFPKQMPFVRAQQRYDAMQKYKGRVEQGLQSLTALKTTSDIPDADNPMYALRSMGLLANNFCASENTGTTNELLLARYYVNEMYLGVNDMKNGDISAYTSMLKAANSYLNMMNRVIIPKVGEPFSLLEIK